jgi:ankyrin repeat protein
VNSPTFIFLTAVLIQDLDSTCTALMVAARRANLDVVRWLVQAGASVNYQDSEVSERTSHYVCLLLNKHVALPKDGNTALILAVQAGRTDAVEVLLQLGADPNIQGKVRSVLISLLAVPTLALCQRVDIE